MPLTVQIEVKPRLVAYLKVRQTQILELAAKYGKVIGARLKKAVDAGDLKTAEAFQGEKEELAALNKVFAEELKDPVTAAKKGGTLPALGAGVPEALVGLRKIWTTELQKIRIKLDGELQRSLKKLEADWTKARDFKNAKAVLIFRESLLSSSPVVAVTSTDSKATPATATMNGSSATASATKEKPYENSLRMRFVPVPIVGGPTDGQRVLFSVWETRVKDYETFLKRNRDLGWEKPNFPQKSDNPAANLIWTNAVAFGVCLPEKEQKSG